MAHLLASLSENHAKSQLDLVEDLRRISFFAIRAFDPVKMFCRREEWLTRVRLC
jgi:hypothetical protein